nr:response regulator transcription factor [Bacilli bacterium]
MKILLVEDDPSLQEILEEALTDERYEVDVASDGIEGQMMMQSGIYDMILLDVMLPGIDGFTLLGKLRKQHSDVPVICITARDAVKDRIHGLDLGADDYLIKPFSVSELLARIRVQSRRKTGNDQGQIVVGDLTIRPDAADAFVDGKSLQLTTKEYDLLEFLARNQGRILTRDQILERVWGMDSDAMSSVIDVYVHYLRKKLADHKSHLTIDTKRGMGFVLRM